MCTIERNSQSKLEQKLLTPASWNDGIKTGVVVVVVSVKLEEVDNGTWLTYVGCEWPVGIDQDRWDVWFLSTSLFS